MSHLISVPAEKTSEERQIDSAGMVAAVEAATLRAQSKAKAEASSAEKVLFDKSKRQSMLSEAMRRGAPTSDSTKQVHDEVIYIVQIAHYYQQALTCFLLAVGKWTQGCFLEG